MLRSQADLLKNLFREIVIPPEVAAEFTRLAASAPRFYGLILPSWIRQQSPTAAATLPATADLDPGESAALSLALMIHADAILIDERRGHAVALQLGLKPIGLLAILIQAKTARLVPKIRPIIDRLAQDAGFWIKKELREQILRLAGE